MEQKKGFLKGALFGALSVLCVVLIGNVIGGKLWGDETEKKLDLIRELADRYFLYDLDKAELSDGICAGYVSGFADDYAAYYDEEATKELQEMTTGEFCGIGARVLQEADTKVLTILEVYPDSPAEKAGMKEGDILYKVDGEDITGKEINEVVGKLKGKEGTDVTATVLRGEKAEEVELQMTRAVIEEQTVVYEMKEDRIGYIRVSAFEAVTEAQYKEALDALEKEGMEGLIVDLRGNPGGNYDTVCAMLDEMLPEGVIVYTEDKDGNKEEEKSDGEHQFTKPLTVLIDGNSASASEIFAGAIQDYGTGTIVGTTSYGKGVVQAVFDLRDGTSLKFTTAQYFTPDGRNIQGKGITPDIEVEYEPNEADPTYDNQLEKAMEITREGM